jgi:flagellar basal-body rod modification protein FlgD
MSVGLSNASSAPTNSLTGSSSSAQSSNPAASLGSIDISQFLKLMITQLQNQDPLNPQSNTEIMQQLGEMQQISASNKLTSTLDAVLLGQSVSNATSLIGKNIDGLDDSGNSATGVVSKVSIVNGDPKLYVGSQIVSLNNVRDVLPTGAATGG